MLTERFFKGPAEKKLAVLGDVSVRVNETYCLEQREWLHDNLIEFYLEYLRHVKYKEQKDKIEIVGPTVTQCIKMTACPKTVEEMIEPLRLKQKAVVLIPVNNADKANAEGSHWSLMVLTPCTGHFYHMDTLDLNKECAKTLAIKLCNILQLERPKFEHFIGTLQDNMVDCGLHVMLNADRAVGHFIDNDSREGFVPAGQDDMEGMRPVVLKAIKDVADMQEKEEEKQMKKQMVAAE